MLNRDTRHYGSVWVAGLAVLVFIDESGKPGLHEEDPFVLAALMVDERVFFDIEDDVNRLVKTELGGYGLPFVELHAKDLIQGKGDFSSIPVHVRARIYWGALEIAAQYAAEGYVEGVVVETRKAFTVKPSRKESRKCVMREAINRVLERVAWALYDFVGRGTAILIIDENELDSYIREVVEDEILRGHYTSRIAASRRILLDPLFARSWHYRCLQLADLVAYTARRIASKKSGRQTRTDKVFRIQEAFYELIVGRILRKGPHGSVAGYGYKHWAVTRC